MEDEILQKLERLKKYVPFIDYLLNINSEKYKKFMNIKNWIIMKHRYPIQVLDKIEQSMITQYKNLFLEKEDIKIPKIIMDIFNKSGVEIKCISVNLCSDDEAEQDKTSDDDIEIVSDRVKTSNSTSNITVLQKTASSPLSSMETINLNHTLPSTSDMESEAVGTLSLEDAETNNLLQRIDEICDMGSEQKIEEPAGAWRYDDFDIPGQEEFSEEGEVIEEKLFKRRNELENEEQNTHYPFKATTAAPTQPEETPVKEKRKKNKKKKKKKEKEKEKDKQKSNKKKTNKLVIVNSTIIIDSTTDDEVESLPRNSKRLSIDQVKPSVASTDDKAIENNATNEQTVKEITFPAVVTQDSIILPTADDSTNTATENVKETTASTSPICLENLDVAELSRVFHDLMQQNNIDLEKCLKHMLFNVHNGATTSKSVSPTKVDKAAPQQANFEQIPENTLSPTMAVNVPQEFVVPTQTQDFNYNYMQQVTNQMYQLPVAPSHFNNTGRRLNLNDPRIMRQLKMIQNSPIYSGIARETAANLTSCIPRMGSIQQAPRPQTITNCNQPRKVAPPPNPGPTTYLEYKRLKAEKEAKAERDRENKIRERQENESRQKLEQEAKVKRDLEERERNEKAQRDREERDREERNREERNREERNREERERKEKAQRDREERDREEQEKKERECQQKEQRDREEREAQKQTAEIRKILFEESLSFKEQVQVVPSTYTNKTTLSGKVTVVNEEPMIEEGHNYAIPKPTAYAEKQVNRILKELECTVKGYDKLEDYIPRTGGKRSSSVSARTAIAEQLNWRFNNSDTANMDTQDEVPCSAAYTTSSSSPSSNASQQVIPPKTSSSSVKPILKRRKSVIEVKLPTIKRRKTMDNDITLRAKNQTMDYSSDDDTYDFEKFRLQKLKALCLKQKASVLLHRLTDEELSVHIRASEKMFQSLNHHTTKQLLNVELVEDKTKSLLSKKAKQCTANNTAKPTIKIKNIDCLMTERNTRCCVLCRSKPSDLTNHYIHKHKTESYIARLNWEELDDLQLNIPFAVPTGTGSSKYKVKCPFCDDDIVGTFATFHTHYSTHTGEYAFQCSMCKLQKPFRADIQSHQLHSKTCRQSRVQNHYIYSPDLLVIYLHCCKICGFLQLNQANVLKHLRDQHGNKLDTPNNCERYILAAINDSEAATDSRPGNSESSPSDLPMPDEVGVPESVEPEISDLNVSDPDVGVMVCNEPICEEPEPEELLSVLFSADAEEMDTNTTPLRPTSSNHQELSFTIKPDLDTNAPSSLKPPRADYALTDNALTPPLTESSRTSCESAPTTLWPAEPGALHKPMQLPPDIKPDVSILDANLDSFMNGFDVEKLMQVLHTSTVTPDKAEGGSELQNSNRSSPKMSQHASPVRATGDSLPPTPTPPRIRITTPNKIQAQRPIQQPTQSATEPRFNTPHIKYQAYPAGTKAYFGLFKCMAADCYFTTDSDDEMLQHLKEHIDSECPPVGILDCAYCQLNADLKCWTTLSPQALVTHIVRRHGRNHFQCPECCYRSCLPGNVLIHRQHAHPPGKDFVYKCAGEEVDHTQSLPQMIIAMTDNVRKLICSHCSYGFYAIDSMDDHLLRVHRISSTANGMLPVRFCCIYCPVNKHSKQEMQEHLALQHPDEFAFVCERVLKPGLKVDSVHNLTLTDISAAVPTNNIKLAHFTSVIGKEDDGFSPLRAANVGMSKMASTVATYTPQQREQLSSIGIADVTRSEAAVDAILQITANNPNEPFTSSVTCANATVVEEGQDLKPSSDDLIHIFVETVKPLLLKLTAQSGMPPDRLYQCAQSACGGFFSLYDLWAKHMRLHHHCFVAACPHCSRSAATNNSVLSLDEFRTHFEQHCRHLYVCFHCDTTSVSEAELRAHATLAHAYAQNENVRLEMIRFNISYSYYVLIERNLLAERLPFLMQLQEVLQQRLRQREEEESERMLTQWLVPSDADEWLDDFPSLSGHSQVEKRCLSPGCPFRTREDTLLFEHLRQTHPINNQTFKCSKCSFVLRQFNKWESISEHVHMHYANPLYVCCACSFYHYDRRLVTAHLRQQHDLRDVPVLSLLRSKHQTRISLAIVFAASHKTFSTLTNCFCCFESNLRMETFAPHLKRKHALSLRYYCELCDEPLPQLLQQSEKHFREKHAEAESTPKIRCELAASEQVTLRSIRPLQLDIGLESICTTTRVRVKDEPAAYASDEDVVMLEDDDLVIDEELKKSACGEPQPKPQLVTTSTTAPLIKCINITNLLSTPPRASTTELLSPNAAAEVNARPRPITIRLVTPPSRAVTTAATSTTSSIVSSITYVPPIVNDPRQSSPVLSTIPIQLTERQFQYSQQAPPTTWTPGGGQQVFFNQHTGHVRLRPPQLHQQQQQHVQTTAAVDPQQNSTRPQVIVAIQAETGLLQLPRPHNSHTG